jgi:hypothetical protein
LCEERILCSSKEQLLKMEEYAIRRAHDAFLELEIARKTATGAVHEQSDEVNCDAIPTSYEFKDAAEQDTNSKRSVEEKLLRQQKDTELKARYSRGQRLKPQQQKSAIEIETGAASDSDGTKGDIISEDNVSERQHHVIRQDDSGYSTSRRQTSLTTDTCLDRGKVWGQKQDIALGFPGRPDLWDRVKQAAKESEIAITTADGRIVSDGIWNTPSLKLLWNDFWGQARTLLSWTVTTSDLAVNLTARDSSFAVGK